MPKHSKRVYALGIISVALIVLVLVHSTRQFGAKGNNGKDSGIAFSATSTHGAGSESGNGIKPLPSQPSPATTTPVKPKPVIPAVPTITAESYLIGNLETGEIYVSKVPNKVVPIASISKLTTALTLQDMYDAAFLSPETEITITKDSLKTEGEEGHLQVGEVFRPDELLSPLILESSNDAAEILATASGYSNFIAGMNQKAKSLGMTSTSYGDASGLSEKNISSATDLFTLAQYLYKNKQDLLLLTRTPQIEFASTTDHQAHIFHNTNPFVGDPHYVGGKTGRTIPAKEAMLSLFDYSVGSTTYPVAVIALRSDFNARQYDVSLLFEQFLDKVDGAH